MGGEAWIGPGAPIRAAGMTGLYRVGLFARRMGRIVIYMQMEQRERGKEKLLRKLIVGPKHTRLMEC